MSFSTQAAAVLKDALFKHPFIEGFSKEVFGQSILLKYGVPVQAIRFKEDRELFGIRLFRAIWEFPLFSGPEPDDETCSFLNQANLCSPTSPLVYDPKQSSYRLLINIRINPDNLRLMTQFLPQLGALQALTAKRVLELKNEPEGLQRLGSFDPTSLKSFEAFENELKNAGATRSSRWEGVELFSAAAGLEATFKEAPKADLASLRLSFPFMDSASDFFLDTKQADPWLGKGITAETFFKTTDNTLKNQKSAAFINVLTLTEDVDHNCLGCLIAEEKGLRHRVFIPNAFFAEDLAQHLSANAYLLSSENGS
jgi:hypothetical protein